MLRHTLPVAALLCSAALFPRAACAADDAELQQLREEIGSLRHDYEARLRALEARLQQMQAPPAGAAAGAASPAATAPTNAPPATPEPIAVAAPSGAANGFNPALSLILSGNYAHLSRDPAGYRDRGLPAPAARSARARAASASANPSSASPRTSTRGSAAPPTSRCTPTTRSRSRRRTCRPPRCRQRLTLKAGRFFSGIGYLNEQHAHTWDFVDAPLAYQAMLGTQSARTACSCAWLAPTERFVELGAELGARHAASPAATTTATAPACAALFAHTGGDIGDEPQLARRRLAAASRAEDQRLRRLRRGRQRRHQAVQRQHARLGRRRASGSGRRTATRTRTNFKLQGEYLRSRRERQPGVRRDGRGQRRRATRRRSRAGTCRASTSSCRAGASGCATTGSTPARADFGAQRRRVRAAPTSRRATSTADARLVARASSAACGCSSRSDQRAPASPTTRSSCNTR